MSVPVTVLCGELGAGKTTLLSHLLESSNREIAVLVNDVGEVNVDADLVEARTDLTTGEEVVALENGCICCSLGGELSRAVIQLWKNYEFDHLVVEASGVGEPEPIARQFVRGPAGGPYDLGAVVTVVDARRFYDRFADADGKPVRRGPDETGSRPLADLLLEQIEFCDRLLVNKCDLVSDAERERVVALLETLQPNAAIATTEYGRLDPEAVLETEAFDLEEVQGSAGWKRAVEDEAGECGHEHAHDDRDGNEHEHHDGSGDHDGRDHDGDHAHDERGHSHPPERYGIEVDAYRRTRPFHPERFAALLADLPDGLVRAKGLCWVAGRERQALTMSYAGTETSLEVTGRWIASLSGERRKRYREARADRHWDDEWGDREIQLALIGRNLEMERLKARLDDCLLTDAEMDDDWSAFENATPTAMGDRTVISTRARDEEPDR